MDHWYVSETFVPTSWIEEQSQKNVSRKRTPSLSSTDYIKRIYFDIYRWWIEQLKSPLSSPMFKKKKTNENRRIKTASAYERSTKTGSKCNNLYRISTSNILLNALQIKHVTSLMTYA